MLHGSAERLQTLSDQDVGKRSDVRSRKNATGLKQLFSRVDEHFQINRKRFTPRRRDCVRRSTNIAKLMERCSRESRLSSFLSSPNFGGTSSVTY